MSSSIERPHAQPLLSVTAFVERSLQVLQQEMPDAYYLLCGMLAPRELLLVVDGEQTPLAFTPSAARLLPAPQQPLVTLRTGRRVILDVIDARLTLQEAVAANAIVLQGAVDELALFHDALLTYVRGGVRCPSFPHLLARFRQSPAPSLHGHHQPDAGQ